MQERTQKMESNYSMPARRRTDDLVPTLLENIIALTGKLGEVSGQLGQHLENDEKYKETLDELLQKQDGDIAEAKKIALDTRDRMDAAKNKAIGIGMGSALGGGGVVAFITKYFPHILQ